MTSEEEQEEEEAVRGGKIIYYRGRGAGRRGSREEGR
jgi:hypothetical protein